MDNGKPDRKIKFSQQVDDPDTISFELTEREKTEIREKARLTVANEIKDRKHEALLAQYLQEEREKNEPAAQLVPCFVQLPGHCEYLMLDGTQFYHNRLYHVTTSVFRVLVEQMARSFAHEEETEVRDVSTKRRHPTPSHIGTANYQDHRRPRDMVVSSSQLAGAPASALLGIGA